MTGRCTSLHILFSFLLYHDIQVMLGEAIVNHRDITGTSPSAAGGGMSGSGLLSVLDPLLRTEPSFCHSSSQTWSSHNIEEERLLSMVSLKAVCWDSVCGALGSSSTFSHED